MEVVEERAARAHGRPSSGRDTGATVSISMVDGASASRDAGHRSRHIAPVSSDSPARARMTPSAEVRMAALHLSSTAAPTASPTAGMLRSRNPATSCPTYSAAS